MAHPFPAVPQRSHRRRGRQGTLVDMVTLSVFALVAGGLRMAQGVVGGRLGRVTAATACERALQAPFWRQRVRNRSLLARKCLLGAELAPESASRTESRPKSPLRRRFLAGRAISPRFRRRGIPLPGNKIPSIHIRRANVYRPARVTDSFTNVYRETRTQRIVCSPSRHKKRVPISGDPRTLVVSEAGLEPARPFSQSLAPQASASANSATPTCALNARSILSHGRAVASANSKFFSREEEIM